MQRELLRENDLVGGLIGTAEGGGRLTGGYRSGSCSQENSGVGDVLWTPEWRRRERLTEWRYRQECVCKMALSGCHWSWELSDGSGFMCAMFWVFRQCASRGSCQKDFRISLQALNSLAGRTDFVLNFL